MLHSENMTSARPEKHAFVVDDHQQGVRLDRFLSEQLSTLSRSRVKTLIKEGHVTIDERTIEEPNYRVKPGETFTISLPAPEPAIPRGEPIPLNVVFEDDAIIVIDKPAGLVVHPAAGHWTGTLVNALIAHCGDSLSGIGGVKRPGIVHRIDKETSGLMVVAKTDAAHKALSKQFANHGRDGQLERTYAALVWGVPERPKGTISAPLGRKVTNRQKMAVVAEGGKEAITHYQVVRRFPEPPEAPPLVSLIHCSLETGRTHQIRVHMAHIGHPLLGDATYGAGFSASARKLPQLAQDALTALGRQALHAQTLAFVHPIKGERLSFESELPNDFQVVFDALSHL